MVAVWRLVGVQTVILCETPLEVAPGTRETEYCGVHRDSRGLLTLRVVPHLMRCGWHAVVVLILRTVIHREYRCRSTYGSLSGAAMNVDIDKH
jgi:hypothetical protein